MDWKVVPRFGAQKYNLVWLPAVFLSPVSLTSMDQLSDFSCIFVSYFLVNEVST